MSDAQPVTRKDGSAGAGSYDAAKGTVTFDTAMPIAGLTATDSVCVESAVNVDMVIDGGIASGYLEMKEVLCEEPVGIGDSFDPAGMYLGQSVAFSGETFHFWGEVNVQGDMYVIGNLSVEGPLKVGGDLYVTGNLDAKDDVLVSGGFTVRGSVAVSGDGATMACHGLADVNDVKITGNISAEGTFIVYGKLEVTEGGSLKIGEYDTVTFVRTGDTKSFRLTVDDGSSVSVYGILDASALISTQIDNKGGISSTEFGGTVDVYYDVFVFVNDNDRSQGEIAAHGKDLTVFPHTDGNITSVKVTVNGSPLPAGLYGFGSDMVCVSAKALDGVAGEIEIFVTSDTDTIPETPKVDSTEEGYAEEAAIVLMAAAMLPSMMCIISQAKREL
jgi:cytoskeletal protein CcmA (bactofilin family)